METDHALSPFDSQVSGVIGFRSKDAKITCCSMKATLPSPDHALTHGSSRELFKYLLMVIAG
jgi:hypothetical protein